MMNDLISVIIPIYNVEKYLPRCIESVTNQEYTNLEIILVDDGSTDGCGSICDDWGKKDCRIRVVHKVNGGLSDARNAGLDICQGEYITFVDSDDYIEKEFIKELIGLIKENNTNVATSSANIVYEGFEDENQIHSEGMYSLEDETIETVDAIKKYYDECKVVYTSSCMKLFHRSIFESLRFPKGKVHEDMYVFPIIFTKESRISSTSKKLYNYLQRTGSITTSKISEKELESRIAYRRYLADYFDGVEYANISERANYEYVNYIANICVFNREWKVAKNEKKAYRISLDKIDKSRLEVQKKIKIYGIYLILFVLVEL